jgi:hypothetical protein
VEGFGVGMCVAVNEAVGGMEAVGEVVEGDEGADC